MHPKNVDFFYFSKLFTTFFTRKLKFCVSVAFEYSNMNQLKEAEKKATQLVQDARKARVDRMKEAKTEAEQIIAAYRAEMEANYQAQAAKITGKSGSAGSELQSTTALEISNMNREYNSKKDAVQKMLIDLVIKVNTKAPQARTH